VAIFWLKRAPRWVQLDQSERATEQDKWKRNREIFAIPHDGEDYLPLDRLNPADHRSCKEMAEILKICGEVKDGWGAAFW
jgi:hypothetical protein